MSLGPKPEATIGRLHDQGFSCLQIHASSPRTWRLPNKSDEALDEIRSLCHENDLDVYLHAIYLLNLASADGTIYENSIRTLRWNLEVAGKLGAKAVTFHVGSHRGQGFDEVRPRIAEAIERILEDAPLGPLLLLENSAGSGDCIGGQVSELGAIIGDAGAPPNLGVCLDTAHAFAMGHDLRTARGVRTLITEIDRSIGLKRLALVHVNDSKTELGSARDRHENIGIGCIGEAGFARFLTHPAICQLPLILETPNLEKRPHELAILRRLVGEQRRAA